MKTFSEESVRFIQEHLQDDVNKLLLQGKRFPHLPVSDLVLQIQARQKAKSKLPNWFSKEQIVFPPMISLEQCSSEATAAYKAGTIEGEVLIDLTGGMGVDISAMAMRFKQAIHLEQNQELSEITAYNFRQLGINNVAFYAQNSIDFLQNYPQRADWIYLDPARRDHSGGKVFRLQDCEPNILEISDLLFEKSGNILLKTSPMLDIDLAVSDLQHVYKIAVVALENEVKEVLFYLKKGFIGEAEKTAVNILKNNRIEEFSFTKSLETGTYITYSQPLKFLYEPNAAILKAGAFKIIAQKFKVQKLQANSHLYTSEALVPDFPGRVFEIEAVCKLDKKEILKYLPDKKANITTRNFPLTVRQIRDKIGISDGGSVFLFATTDQFNQKIILICKKLVF